MTAAETKNAVAQLWEKLLGIRPDEKSDFFADGGHSLVAARFVAKLSKLFEADFDVSVVFDTPRFGDLCEALAESRPTHPTSTGSEARRSGGAARRLPMLPGQKSVVRKRTAAERDGIAASAFTLPPIAVTIAAHVTRSDVERALRVVIAGQPSLRMVLNADLTVEIARADQAGVEVDEVAVESADQATAIGLALCARPFALDELPRLRARLVSTPRQRCLMLCLDHLVADHYAAKIVVDELLEELRQPTVSIRSELDDSRTAALERITSDLANSLEGPRLSEALRYWAAATAGTIVPETTLVDLPAFQPSNLAAPSKADVSLAPGTWQRVTQCARRHGTTPFAVLMASVWHRAQVLGTREYLVTPVSNRRTADADDLVAFLSHAVVRVPPALGISPADLVAYAGGLLRESAGHEWVPHATLIEALATPLYGKIRSYPWVLFDFAQDPWPDGVEELPEPLWNNTVIRLQFCVSGTSLALQCTAGADVLPVSSAHDLVLGIATSLGDLLDSPGSGR